MKKFLFTAKVTVSAFTEVIAETEDEARKIVVDRQPVLADEWKSTKYKHHWAIEDADGEADDIELTSFDETDEAPSEEDDE